MNSSEYTRSVEYETRNTRSKKCVTVAVAKGVNESSPSLEETRRKEENGVSRNHAEAGKR